MTRLQVCISVGVSLDRSKDSKGESMMTSRRDCGLTALRTVVANDALILEEIKWPANSTLASTYVRRWSF